SHPVIFNALVELANEFEIKAIRTPREELLPALKFDPSSLAMKTLWYSVFRCLSAYGSGKLRRAGIVSADRVYGLLQSVKMTEAYLLNVLDRIKGRSAEIYSHPAREVEGEPLNGPPGAGLLELEALLSPRVRKAIEDAGLALGNFNQAEEMALN
ncbi:MAG TPA: ChbG/HpnK family deacetylase, partial [Blastocatellia bacterium]|nr:ChbG/HpnK family deacetylase [Blastocatellia bacterium]